MATRKPDQTKRPPGEDDLARVYRAAAADGPSPALDARILAEARSAVGASATSRHSRWTVPLSTAAVVVLAVGVVLLMTRQGALNHRSELEAPNEYSMAPATPSASTPPLADAREEQQATAPAKTRRTGPEPAKPAAMAESGEGKLARQAPAEAKKKAEVPASAPPPAVGRALEMDRMPQPREEPSRSRLVTAGVAAMKTSGADVVAVQVSGSPGAYSFNVTVKSPDTGCQQYADWWEVLSEDGRLLYRRVLFHSHVGEQPFTRDGGPVPIQPETVVWVRAHMNTSGYGGEALKGSVKSGFKPAVPEAGFASGVARQPPLPDGCAF